MCGSTRLLLCPTYAYEKGMMERYKKIDKFFIKFFGTTVLNS